MARTSRRDPRREARWRKLIERQQSSGTSIRGFCRGRGITESAFHYWRRELRRRDAERQQRTEPEPSAEPAFLPVRITDPDDGDASGVIEIIRPDGWQVAVRGAVDRQALADVLAALCTGSVRSAAGSEAGSPAGREAAVC